MRVLGVEVLAETEAPEMVRNGPGRRAGSDLSSSKRREWVGERKRSEEVGERKRAEERT